MCSKHAGKVRIQLFLNNLLWSSLLLAIPGHTDQYETATNRTWQEWQKGSSFRAKRGITIISAYVPHSGTFDLISFQILKYYFDLDSDTFDPISFQILKFGLYHSSHPRGLKKIKWWILFSHGGTFNPISYQISKWIWTSLFIRLHLNRNVEMGLSRLFQSRKQPFNLQPLF